MKSKKGGDSTKTLKIEKNMNITTLDLSGYPDLEKLVLYETGITKLDLSHCPKLTVLHCENCKLIELDLSPCPNLQILHCGKNQLTILNLLPCSKLLSFNCGRNQLTNLDLTNCLKLVILDCHNNKLNNLDLSPCPNLQTLDCSVNQLTNLDLTPCPNLENLDLNRNRLTQFPIFPISLTFLGIEDNPITDFQLQDNFLELDIDIRDYIEDFFVNAGEPFPFTTRIPIQAQVDPMQAHRASSKINFYELVVFFKNYVIEPYRAVFKKKNVVAHFIETRLQRFIQEISIKDAKNKMLNGLETLMQNRLKKYDYSDESPVKLETIFYVLEYVGKQNNEFIDLYVNSFLYDCLNAYNGEGTEAMSCVGGIIERLVLSLEPASIVGKGKKIEEYQKLVAIIHSNPSLINDYVLEWFKFHSREDQRFPETATKESKLEDLKQFLLSKFPNTSTETKELIDKKVEETGDAFDLEADDFEYSGGRKTRKLKIKQKSIKQKSIKQKSIKQKSIKQKSIKQKSIKQKSIKQKSKNKK
jgi:hypothetical protein